MKDKNPVALDKRRVRRAVVESDPKVSRDAPCEYLPRTKYPSADDCADDLPTPNVDIARAERAHVIPGTQ